MVRKLRLIPEDIFEKIRSFQYVPPKQLPSGDMILNSKIPDDAKLILYQENARNENQKRINKENKPLLVKDITMAKHLDLYNEMSNNKARKDQNLDEEDEEREDFLINETETKQCNSNVSYKRKSKFDQDENECSEKRKKGRPPKKKNSVFDTRICPDNSPFYATKYTKVEPHLLVKKERLKIGSKRNRRDKNTITSEDLWEDYQDKFLQKDPKIPKTALDLKRKNQFKMKSLKRMQMEDKNYVVKTGTKNLNAIDDLDEQPVRRSERSTKGINKWTKYIYL